MTEKIALNLNSFNAYLPPKLDNIIKFPSSSLNYEFSSYNYNTDFISQNKKANYPNKNNSSIKENADLINKSNKTRNSDIINKYNNIIYSNEKRKNKKMELNKSMDKILKSKKIQFDYEYNNKSINKINKEIIKFKDKMNKDKEYLNYIQNELFPKYEKSYGEQNNIYNDIKKDYLIKDKRRSYSLTNRGHYNNIYLNINRNINYEFNDYFSEKRKIKNVIINNNNFIDNNAIYQNSLKNYQENNFINNNYPKRSNSFLSSNKNELFNKYILNKNIYLKEDKIKCQKECSKDNKLNNNYENEYIKYPDKNNITQKQCDIKYLTINPKNDKIQLKEKEIKINEISNLNNNIINNLSEYNNSNNKNNLINFTQPNIDKNNIKKDLFHIRKFDKYVDNIINENSKESIINIDKNTKISLNTLNNIDLLTNYENIKKKYNNKNNINDLSSYNNSKNFYRKRSCTFINEDKKGQKNIITLNQNKINNTNKISSLNNIDNKYFEDDYLKTLKSKYSDSIKNEDYRNSKSDNSNYTISSFSINILPKEDKNKNKDLLIKNLKERIIELENELNIANSKIKEFLKLIEELKKKKKEDSLYIDKINSFNFIKIKNHFIKINKPILNTLNIKNKKIQNLNKDKPDLNYQNGSIIAKSKSSSKYLNTTSENDHYSYSSFDNYKNLNLYFRKITTFEDEQKLNKSKPTSLTKRTIKYNKNILLNKKNIKKEIIINNKNNNSLEDININEKIIYTIYLSSKDNNLKIIFFDPESKKFSFQKFMDKNNFEENYKNNIYKNYNNMNKSENSNIFLFNDGYLYVITGQNFDIFYKLDPYKKEIIKLCTLNYNHSNGNLVYYDQRIFCLSGDFNKKVECYIESKNEWIVIPEMLTERSNFTTCIIKEQYLFSLFGYNNINKQYLNSIEFIDLLCENAEWKYLYYENENGSNNSLYLTGALGMNFDDKRIIIFGGYDGKNKKENYSFYQINLKKNFEENYEICEDKLSNIVKIGNSSDPKTNDINKLYYFEYGYNKYYEENNNFIYNAFDIGFNSHLININTFSHEIFNFQ